MVQFYECMSDSLRDWALKQQLFFVASAPLVGKHVNVSPKGLPSTTFTVFDPNHAGYVDMTGSGAETISHIYENGRVTVMFCSFDQSPRILRLFCTGRVVEYDNPSFSDLLAKMGKSDFPGARAVILLDIWKVQTSCGYAVPQMSDNEEGLSKSELLDRQTLHSWAAQKSKQGLLEEYRAKNNARSLDGLCGMAVARRTKGEWIWIGNLMEVLSPIAQQKTAMAVGAFGMLLLLILLNQVPALDRTLSFKNSNIQA